MIQANKVLSGVDWFIVAASAILVTLGVLFIYSSGMTSEGVLISRDYVKQIVWAATGLVLMVLVTFLDYKRLGDYAFLIFAFLLLVLVYTRLFGRVVNGAKSWLGIGEAGLQPSEFMKIASILFLSKYLENSRHAVGAFRRFATALSIVLVPVLLILSQPDFGTALVFFPIFLAIAYVHDVDAKYLLFIIVVVAIAGLLLVVPLWQKTTGIREASPLLRVLTEAPYIFYSLAFSLALLALSLFGFASFRKRHFFWLAYGFFIVFLSIGTAYAARKVLKEYQVMRLIVFLDPSVDPLGSGWNILQSITAIGAGGLAGKGFLQGTQSHYRYLPQQSTDFIFSILSEEIGFLGSLFVFALFAIILIRLVFIMRNLADRYALGIIAGFFAMIAFHFMINVGMAMGIMPITGIPLFFLSYGGSSLWAVMIALGIVQSINVRKYSI